MLKIHIFHTFGKWEEMGHGMIVRARHDVIKGQILRTDDIGKIVIGKFVKYKQQCKSCPKYKTKYEDILY